SIWDREQPRHRHGSQHVFDVEAAAEPRTQLDAAGTQLRAVFVEEQLLRANVGVVSEAERQQALVAQCPQLVREPAPVLVADIDRGRGPLALDEEPALSIEVALERSVEVEMVLAEVCERQGREVDARQPAKLGSVGGRLERAAAVPRVEHLPEGALKVDRLGSRADRRSPFVADAALDRAEQARTSPGRGEDRVEEKRGRRLPVRAGDAGEL